MHYLGMEFCERDFLAAYTNYSIVERMTCVLTQSLNVDLNSFNFDPYVHVFLVERNLDLLEYYWFDETIKKHQIQISDFISDDKEKIKNYIKLRFDLLKAEGIINEEWSQIGDVQHLLNIENREIYFVAVASWRGYPTSTLWGHFINVFVQNWQWEWEDTNQLNLVKKMSPSDVIQNTDFHWSTFASPCCRVMAEYGFDSGYGDPYESQYLFDIISNISTAFYEKRSSMGVIVPLPVGMEPEISFAEPIVIELESVKVLRKYLEMTRNGLALAIKEMKVVGLISSSCSNCKILISGTNKWQFSNNDDVLFSFDNGLVSVNTNLSDEREVFTVEQRKFISSIDTIDEIAKMAAHQTHGTTVVFTDEAQEESRRLSDYHRCERIRPIDLHQHKGYILPLTSIDGALMVSLDGICYGVGAILDGEAVKPGSLGRGARYNSALNYIAWRKQKRTKDQYCACAVVISEDGIISSIFSQNVDMITEDFE